MLLGKRFLTSTRTDANVDRTADPGILDDIPSSEVSWLVNIVSKKKKIFLNLCSRRQGPRKEQSQRNQGCRKKSPPTKGEIPPATVLGVSW